MIRGKIIISEKAVSDLLSIRQYYNNKKDNLGDDFVKAVEKALLKVEKHPSSFNYVSKNIRRCEPAKFPYYIYFSYSNGIEILRIRHTKQNQLKRFR